MPRSPPHVELYGVTTIVMVTHRTLLFTRSKRTPVAIKPHQICERKKNPTTTNGTTNRKKEIQRKSYTNDPRKQTEKKKKRLTEEIAAVRASTSHREPKHRRSLEEILHGNNNGKHALSWEQRYNVAVGIAEGPNYIHNELSRPVIHRDVKSSNILLSDGFEPKLSDFGLAIWGPTDSSFLLQADVVGTFGYLAPEYFMYGKLSDKIDVYAFGVFILELLSGKDL
ncbi:serine/threonine-protein kinase PBS1-like [Hibiscus syriacus]|uniref:serine/threonine-protein kinase PBS1-like n=1 Tax=Hibiscus syriacus TaxID=106335 RepID=UPI001922AC5B|nr:serine/threonine-protein kinase PBS1-like [Hibiscus syriacus]